MLYIGEKETVTSVQQPKSDRTENEIASKVDSDEPLTTAIKESSTGFIDTEQVSCKEAKSDAKESK